MILELDYGNTYAKWRLVDRAYVLLAEGKLKSLDAKYEYFLAESVFDDVELVLICAVVKSELIAHLVEMFMLSLGAGNVFVAKSRAELSGVKFNYVDVSRLGVDRCLVMISAYRHHPEGVLVVDCGSAITADLVSSTGMHIGGYILPGLGMLQRSLVSGTSDIYLNECVRGRLSPGGSTEECVVNGVLTMAVSSLRSLAAKAREYGINHFLITGGDAEVLQVQGLTEFEIKRNLVFEGLEIASSDTGNQQ